MSIGSVSEEIPDLLNATPTLSLNADATDQALVFAFAGGSTGSVFAEALAQTRLAPSTWDPKCYEDDVFLKDFVRLCFQPSARSGAQANTGYLTRVLGSPPSDVQTLVYRQQILAELLSVPELRRAAEQLHTHLTHFRAGIETNASTARGEYARRQLAILRVFQALMQRMATGFLGAQSGLTRLSSFAAIVTGSEAFASLSELLRYDDRLATVNFKVGIGADGYVRHLELLSVSENDHNPFTQSPLRRWLVKLELFFRGYHFGDGEVMARLVDAVFEGVRPFWTPLVQLYGDLEFYLAALGFYDRTCAAELPVCFPEFVDAKQPREFLGLFNPLLMANNLRPRGSDLRTDRQDVTVLITGPNSGGKTRLLQSLGLAQLLAQSGLFVPARKAQMALCSGLVMSLIQETHADQTEGRLGVELMRIRMLFEQLPPGALVLLDELCSGTNPAEGEEIVELVIRMLTRLRPQAYITTHFLEFAGRLARDKPIADLRFLKVLLGPNHEPTYQFAEGVAGSSLASRAASRLGVTSDQLQALVEQKLTQYNLR